MRRSVVAIVCVVIACALAVWSWTNAGDGSKRDVWAEWELATDAYQLSYEEVVSAASAILAAECMSESGAPMQVDADVFRPRPRPPGVNKVGRLVFSEGVAREFGYRFPTVATGWTPSPILDEDYAACLDRALDELPAPPVENHAYGVSAAAYWAALHSPAVRLASEEWRNCMSTGGVRDLPETPEEMPNAAAWEQIGVAPENVDSLSEPTESERTMAMADATCRRSSGFDSALYEAESAENARLAVEKVEVLEAERRAHERRRRAAQAVVTHYLDQAGFASQTR